jgi:hypothetical protein
VFLAASSLRHHRRDILLASSGMMPSGADLRISQAIGIIPMIIWLNGQL